MTDTKIKLPKKGAAKRVSDSFAKLRKRPLGKELFEIVDANYDREKNEKPEKKIANPRPPKDVEV